MGTCESLFGIIAVQMIYLKICLAVLAFTRITDTGVQKITSLVELTRVTIQMYVNEINAMLFVKDLVAKNGQNLFGKWFKNI